MKLNIQSSNNFTIKDGMLKSDEPFLVEKNGTDLVIKDIKDIKDLNFAEDLCSDIFSSFKNFGSLFFNSQSSSSSSSSSSSGVSTRINNGHVFINGKVNSVTINGKKITPGNEPMIPRVPKENEFTFYSIPKDINSISISSGSVVVTLDSDNMILSVNGSGDIDVNGKVRKLQLDVVGSGDISVNNMVSENCSASVVGSGDVKFYNCSLRTLQLKVVGSGDITGECNSIGNVSKSIIGSGDITGF